MLIAAGAGGPGCFFAALSTRGRSRYPFYPGAGERKPNIGSRLWFLLRVLPSLLGYSSGVARRLAMIVAGSADLPQRSIKCGVAPWCRKTSARVRLIPCWSMFLASLHRGDLLGSCPRCFLGAAMMTSGWCRARQKIITSRPLTPASPAEAGRRTNLGGRNRSPGNHQVQERPESQAETDPKAAREANRQEASGETEAAITDRTRGQTSRPPGIRPPEAPDPRVPGAAASPRPSKTA